MGINLMQYVVLIGKPPNIRFCSSFSLVQAARIISSAFGNHNPPKSFVKCSSSAFWGSFLWWDSQSARDTKTTDLCRECAGCGQLWATLVSNYLSEPFAFRVLQFASPGPALVIPWPKGTSRFLLAIISLKVLVYLLTAFIVCDDLYKSIIHTVKVPTSSVSHDQTAFWLLIHCSRMVNGLLEVT